MCATTVFVQAISIHLVGVAQLVGQPNGHYSSTANRPRWSEGVCTAHARPSTASLGAHQSTAAQYPQGHWTRRHVRALKKPTGLSFPGFGFGAHPSQAGQQVVPATASTAPQPPARLVGSAAWRGGVVYWQRFQTAYGQQRPGERA